MGTRSQGGGYPGDKTLASPGCTIARVVLLKERFHIRNLNPGQHVKYRDVGEMSVTKFLRFRQCLIDCEALLELYGSRRAHRTKNVTGQCNSPLPSDKVGVRT